MFQETGLITPPDVILLGGAPSKECQCLSRVPACQVNLPPHSGSSHSPGSGWGFTFPWRGAYSRGLSLPDQLLDEKLGTSRAPAGLHLIHVLCEL